VAYLRFSIFIAAQEGSELFERGIQLGMDQSKYVAFEQHEQHRASNLNRDENDNDCGSKQSET
jgi:hypothetical protein